MKIVATSDLHGDLPDIEPCDLLIIAGDMCPDGAPPFQGKWFDTAFRKWIDKVPAKEVVMIAGNHDLIFERGMQYYPSDLRCHYLQDSSIELFGFKIYGTPWQLPFWGAFNLPEEELEKKYQHIPQGIDILISHSPPYCIADLVSTAHEDLHTGSISLRKKAFEIKPKLFVCGHIHCAAGIYTIENITFANVCLLDDDMKEAHPPAVFYV